eukprot:SAG22_NODE_203_length_15320_cov_14.023516_10_plen_244_part_00
MGACTSGGHPCHQLAASLYVARFGGNATQIAAWGDRAKAQVLSEVAAIAKTPSAGASSGFNGAWFDNYERNIEQLVATYDVVTDRFSANEAAQMERAFATVADLPLPFVVVPRMQRAGANRFVLTMHGGDAPATVKLELPWAVRCCPGLHSWTPAPPMFLPPNWCPGLAIVLGKHRRRRHRAPPTRAGNPPPTRAGWRTNPVHVWRGLSHRWLVTNSSVAAAAAAAAAPSAAAEEEGPGRAGV